MNWKILWVVFFVIGCAPSESPKTIEPTKEIPVAIEAERGGIDSLTLNWTNPVAHEDGSPLLNEDIVQYTFYCNGEVVANILNEGYMTTWEIPQGLLESGQHTCHLTVTSNRDGPDIESTMTNNIFIHCSRSRALGDQGVVCEGRKEFEGTK